MVSRSQHWLHQFQMVTEHSLKGATNYGNRTTGIGTKHAVLRPRPRPGQNELECTRVESRNHGLEITRLPGGLSMQSNEADKSRRPSVGSRQN